MSDQQLEESMANGQEVKVPGNTISSGRETPIQVIETYEMDWLGAEAGVIFPEGGSNVVPR